MIVRRSPYLFLLFLASILLSACLEADALRSEGTQQLVSEISEPPAVILFL